jgi:hypothetical protein
MRPFLFFFSRSSITMKPLLFLGRSPITIRPILYFFTWVGHPLQSYPFFVFFFHRVGHPLQWDHLTKKKLNKEKKKEKEEGFSQLFLFTKLTIQSQKKINFLMPLHRKHCKEGATVVT